MQLKDDFGNILCVYGLCLMRFIFFFVEYFLTVISHVISSGWPEISVRIEISLNIAFFFKCLTLKVD